MLLLRLCFERSIGRLGFLNSRVMLNGFTAPDIVILGMFIAQLYVMSPKAQ